MSDNQLTAPLAPSRPRQVTRWQTVKLRLKKSAPLYVLLAPSLTLLVIFSYIPIYGLVIAFQDYAPVLGISGSEWVGFENFIQYFRSYQFWLTIKNTLVISVYSLLVNTPLPVALAILCNQIRHERFKKTFQVITYLPHFISTMVMCGMILLFLNPATGLLAHFSQLVGLHLPDVIADPKNFVHIYVWSNVWQNLGWHSIIYLAALSAIDPVYYEAASIDGASAWQKIWHLDLPLIMPTIVILLIMSVGRLLNVGFEKVLLLQNPLNMPASEIISTYVYKVGLGSSQYSLSTAIGLFNTLINGTLLISVNWFSKRLAKLSLF
ncbi:ABC transporter permease [Lacticaseibacillus mingshuiensis]|uniref:ABC transporter permease n=1 Tax=Lacticaseibacillus mingshuiensis TaxID=2799574 RepID=A0ABW4CGZ5_9LACO|nr:ABC transporter permease subunit [Lacticaseibacillus mingshuiensis]